MNFETSTRNCRHTRLTNGIFEFIFFNNDRSSADEFFAILDKYFSALERDEIQIPVAHVLIELRQAGMPPVAYMSGRYRDFLIRYKGNLPPTRFVYLYTSGFMVSIVRTFLAFIPERNTVQRQSFHVSEREKAETWLLDEVESTSGTHS